MNTTSPDALQPLEGEIATYRRELPRLLTEGNAAQFALVKSDVVVSVWDTRLVAQSL